MKIICGIGNCKKSFDPKNIARHRATHSAKNISCGTCGKKFATQDYLTKHINRHHLKLTKLCEFCGRQFLNPSLLTRHKKTRNKFHFQCNTCCSSFQLQQNLEDHMQAVHSGVTGTEVEGTVSTVTMDPLRNPDQANQPRPLVSALLTRESSRVVVKRPRLSNDQVIDESSVPENSSDVNDNDRTVVLQTQAGPSTTGQKKAVSFAPDPQEIDSDQDEFGPTQANVPAAHGDDEGGDFFENSQEIVQDNEMEDQRIEGNSGPEETPILNLGANSKLVVTEQEQQVVGMEFEEWFVFKMFGLVKDRAFYDNFKKQLSDDNKQILTTIAEYLANTRSFANNEQILGFLRMAPQVYIGRFLVAVLVVDYCFRADPKVVSELCKIVGLEAPGFENVVGLTTQYILQRSKRVDVEEVCKNDEIPKALLDKLDYNFLSFYTSEESKVTTVVENELSSQIHLLFLDILFQDIKSKEAALLDPSVDQLDRAQLWSHLAEIVTKLGNVSPQPPLFETLLLHHQRRMQFTKEYFEIETRNGTTPIHFHAGVVKKFGGLENMEKVPVSATMDDVSILTALLYSSYNAEKIIPKITVPVFKMARLLRLANVWHFLFRGKSFEDILKLVDRKTLLHVIVQTRHDEFAGKVAQAFGDFLPQKDQRETFLGLDHQDMLYFFDNPFLKITDMEMYTIVAHWSFDKAGKPEKFDPDAKRMFDILRGLVKLERLDLVTVASHGLVSMEEIKLARKVQLRGRNE